MRKGSFGIKKENRTENYADTLSRGRNYGGLNSEVFLTRVSVSKYLTL